MCIIIEVFYFGARKKWHVKADHDTQVEGGYRRYFTSESEYVVDIFISRGRGKSNPGMVNHISAYNNKLSFTEKLHRRYCNHM